MGTDINETGNAGMKDETRGTGTNGRVSEMQRKQDRLEDRKGIVEEGGAEQTYQRSIGDQYLTLSPEHCLIFSLHCPWGHPLADGVLQSQCPCVGCIFY